MPSSGHTLTATLLSAGQYKAAATTYAYRISRLVEDGAPVAFPAALGSGAEHVCRRRGLGHRGEPAAGLLLVEYGLTDNQAFYVDGGRTPTNKNYQGGADLIPGLDLVPIDYESLAKDQAKWAKLYDDMMKSSGRPVRSLDRGMVAGADTGRAPVRVIGQVLSNLRYSWPASFVAGRCGSGGLPRDRAHSLPRQRDVQYG